MACRGLAGRGFPQVSSECVAEPGRTSSGIRASSDRQPYRRGDVLRVAGMPADSRHGARLPSSTHDQRKAPTWPALRSRRLLRDHHRVPSPQAAAARPGLRGCGGARTATPAIHRPIASACVGTDARPPPRTVSAARRAAFAAAAGVQIPLGHHRQQGPWHLGRGMASRLLRPSAAKRAAIARAGALPARNPLRGGLATRIEDYPYWYCAWVSATGDLLI